MLEEGRGDIDVYFTRVYNPLWVNPDGFMWLKALKDESKIKCYVALTPTWNETAWFADYVLPMGHGTRTSRSFESGNALGTMDRIPSTCAPRGDGTRGHQSRFHLSSQPWRGLGGERVLDSTLRAHGPRWFARHSSVVRVAVSQGRDHHRRGILSLDFRKLRAWSARSRRKRRT